MATMLDGIRMMARGEVAAPPIAQLIGFSLREVDAGRAVIDFEATPRHASPLGTLHGGVFADIADAGDGNVPLICILEPWHCR
jgi:acyl-coenzyme A thioesterase PaaI-like protein